MDWKEYLKEWKENNSFVIPDDLEALRQEFNQRFPKEKLAELTLEEYAMGNHEQNPDSFSQWIEFTTAELGSIGGGSAKKHGIYWSKSADNWWWSKLSHMKTADDAFKQIKTGFIQLIHAIEERNFSELDNIADRYLGKNSNVLRGKPLYLYYPDLFIPIFSIKELDYFLELFELATSGGALFKNLKLYDYLSSLPEFQDFDSWNIMSFLYDLKEENNREVLDNDQKVWKISPGKKAWFWKECLEGEFICIGWADLGDISDFDLSKFESKSDELIKISDGKHTKYGLNQVWKFAKEIKKGDKILANRGTKEIIGVGTVVGDYYFEDGETYPHRLPVRWDDAKVKDIDEKGWVKTLIPVTLEKYKKITSSYLNPSLTQEELQKQTLVNFNYLEKVIQSLARKKQIVLCGSPGTGKTFLAKKLAQYLISGSDGHGEILQFHPAYTYEDFVQGLRPLRDGDEEGNLKYDIVPGRFLEFCEKARSRDGNCVLIIDEINRANLSSVFGELMYLLEYRDQEIKLAGSNESFSIPENVYIIGTMNTADRSIALVDHALRRRFAFIELRPNYDILRKWHAREETGFDVEPLIQEIEQVNAAIGDRHYHLGISYFLDRELQGNIGDIWEFEIYPYLEEYFYSEPETVSQFTWENLKGVILGESEG